MHPVFPHTLYLSSPSRYLFYVHNLFHSILVVGGAGEYFSVADRVIMMEKYSPFDVTDKAKGIASTFDAARDKLLAAVGGAGGEGVAASAAVSAAKGKGKERGRVCFRRRVPLVDSFRYPGGRCVARSKALIVLGGDREGGGVEVDLTCVEQLVEHSQTRALVTILERLGTSSAVGSGEPLDSILQRIDEAIDS